MKKDFGLTGGGGFRRWGSLGGCARAVLLLLLLLLVGLGLGLTACKPTPEKPVFSNTDITGGNYARGFKLEDVNGQWRSLADFKGQVVVLFFGYTHCPDVCPTTLAMLAQTRQLLGKDGEKLKAVFVTLDPERDTLPVLKNYVASFDTQFVALRPQPQGLPDLAQEFKLHYAKVPAASEHAGHEADEKHEEHRKEKKHHGEYGEADKHAGHGGAYRLDHSAGSFVFDPQGRVRLYVAQGVDPKVLAADVRVLLNAGAL